MTDARIAATGADAFVVGTPTARVEATGADAFVVGTPTARVEATGADAFYIYGTATTGSGTATAPTATATGEGTSTATAQGTATAPAPAATGSGTSTATGEGTAAAPAPAATGAGVSDDTTFGEGTASAPTPTVTGAGTSTVTGAGTAAAPSPTSSGVGTATALGEGTATAPAPSATGTGTVAGGAVDGTGTATAPTPGATGAGTSDIVTGWVDDLTGRALIGVGTNVTDLHVPPAPMEIPGGVDVVTLVRNSHQMPALTSIKRRYREDEYTVLDSQTLGGAAVIGVPHVWVDGVDRTYDLDGELVDVDDLLSEIGFGDRSAKADILRMQLWQERGAGDWAWLRPAAQVEVGVINGDTRHIWWAGDLISESADSLSRKGGGTFTSSWVAQGPLVQAMQAVMQPLDRMDSTDIGIVIPRVLNAVISRRYPPIPTMTTGIPTLKLGSYGQKVGEYVRTLLATAWDGNSQLQLVRDSVNPRQYRLAWTDTETVHWTVTAGAPGISLKLTEDWTQVTNVIFGRGTLPNGHRWMNRRFPYLLPYTPPTYFSGDTSAVLSLGSTDAGTINNGVSLYTQRLRELGYNVPLSSVMLSVHVSATRNLQTKRGLLVDGLVGGQTWTSVWSVGATGADLRSVRLPLWADPRVEPWFYLPNGAIAEPNPQYDPLWPRVEEDIDYGDNTTLQVGIADATQRGERLKEPALVGTASLETDPWNGSRFHIQPAENLQVIGWRGRDVVLHIADRRIQRKAGTVALTLDSAFRDALTIRQVMARDAESRDDPARRPGAIGRTRSTSAPDMTTPFDGDSPAGIMPELTLRGGLWSVWPVAIDQVGTLSRVWAKTYDPVCEFAMLMFGMEVLPSELVANVGNVLVQSRPWESPSVDAFLTRKGFITGWGQSGEACGYQPGSKQNGGAVTGLFETAAPNQYVSVTPPFVWVAMLPASDCRIQAEFDPQPKG